MKWILILSLAFSLQTFAQSASEALRITNPKSNFYEVLGVGSKATPEEIKSAYRKLMSTYHPDRHQNNPANLRAANQVMTKLNAAREVLLDPLKRKSYDLTVKATAPLKPQPEKQRASAETAKAQKTSEAKTETKPEAKAQSSEIKTETKTSKSPSTSSTTYSSKQAQKVYSETSRCGVGYFKTFIDVML